MIEHIQRAGDIDFQSGGNELRFFFLLPAQTVIQITEDGHILRLGVIEIILIHHPHTAVNNGFLHGFQTVLAAHDQLTQRQNEVRFQRKRVFLVAVIEVDVHGVDVMLGGGRNLDDLSLQPLHQGEVFSLGIAYHNVIVGGEEHIGNFPLGGEGLARTGCAENQTVGVFQQLPIHHDDVVGQGVDSIVQRLRAVLEQFLGGEGNEDCHTRGSQSPLNLNLVEAQGQAADHAFLLLIIQLGELTVVFLGNGIGLKHIVVQLPLGVGGVEDQKSHKEHSLVPALKVCQQLLGFCTVGGKIGGNDVHVISGTDSLFLLLDLTLVQIGDGALDGLDGADLIHGLHMDIDHNVAFNIQKVLENPVTQLRCQNLQEADRRELLTHAEILCPVKEERTGGNVILGGQPGAGQIFPAESKRLRRVHAENVMENPKPLLSVQHLGADAQPFEVVEDVRFNAL